MLHVQAITDLGHPMLAPYLSMKWQHEHRRQRIFVAEGEKVVRRLLESSFTVVSLLLPEKWFQDLKPLLDQRPGEIHVFVAEKQLLEKMTGYSMYQGLLAIGKIPAPVALDSITQNTPRPFFFVASDGLSNAENVGVLVRNCVAFGAQALVVGETSSSPYLRRAVRSSMGTVFKLPVVEVDNLVEALLTLRKAGVQCVAAHPHDEQHQLHETGLNHDCCLVFGGEGQGVSAPVLEACDKAVAIPMRSGVDSLNVGSASAVFLYEADRQRRS